MITKICVFTNTCHGYSLEVPHQGTSDEYHKVFSWRNKNKYQYIFVEKKLFQFPWDLLHCKVSFLGSIALFSFIMEWTLSIHVFTVCFPCVSGSCTTTFLQLDVHADNIILFFKTFLLLVFSMFYKIPVINANCVDPDQTQHSVASDLSLRCLPTTHLRVSRIKWVNIQFLMQILYLYTNFEFSRCCPVMTTVTKTSFCQV